METIRFTKEERERARAWVNDERWVKTEKYLLDTAYVDCVRDILGSPAFQSMDRFIQHGKTTCKDHCLKVSYMSYQICRKFGWDFQAAARGGLLHDLFLYDWHTRGNHIHGFTHPKAALENAEHYFSLNDTEKDVILRHMWPLTPIPPRSRAGFAVVYADKFCTSAEVVARVKTGLLGKKGVLHHDTMGKYTI